MFSSSARPANIRLLGYGGFPSFPTLMRKLLLGCFSTSSGIPLTRSISRKLEVPRTQTLQSSQNIAGRHLGTQDPSVKTVSYFKFDTTVGKNSAFKNLSEEQKEELGGVELRALNLLGWIVPSYWLGTQLLGFLILAPYLSRAQFREALTSEGGQVAAVNSTW